VTGLSAALNYSLMWLDEATGVWSFGGVVPADRFMTEVFGEICGCPQPGETYQKMGATGQIVQARAL
jgi:hypothetical protein